jgi:hypothetical protein
MSLDQFDNEDILMEEEVLDLKQICDKFTPVRYIAYLLHNSLAQLYKRSPFLTVG